MALKPKYDYQPEAYTRVIPRVQDVEKRSGVVFSRAQLLIGTAAMAGSMLAVFLFGFYSGHEKGIEQGLSEGGRLAVRLPVPEQTTTIAAAIPNDKPVLTVDNGKVATAPGPIKAGIVGIKERSTIDTLAALSSTPAAAPKAKLDKAVSEKAATIADRAPAKAPVKAAKVVAKKPAAKASSVKKTPLLKVSSSVPSGFYIQIAARKDASSARKLGATLDAKSYPVQIEKAVVKGRKYFRVLVGPYKNRSSAVKRQSGVARAVKQSSKPFIKKVK